MAIHHAIELYGAYRRLTTNRLPRGAFPLARAQSLPARTFEQLTLNVIARKKVGTTQTAPHINRQIERIVSNMCMPLQCLMVDLSTS